MLNHHSLIPWGSFRGQREEKWGSFRGLYKAYTPHSKMAAILVFFYLLTMLQISPCFLVLKLEIQKNIFP